VAEFFAQNLVTVFFFYGLAFFCMGLAIFVEVGHSTENYFARALRPLSWFGLIHGSHEWLEMFLIFQGGQGQQFDPGVVNGLRLILLASSFCMLLIFGIWLVAAALNTRQKLGIFGVAAGIYAIGLIWLLVSKEASPLALVQADVYTRYALAIPGATLTTWGLILQRRRFQDAGLHSFGKDVLWAAIAFGLYGGVGQLFATPTQMFPSSLLNAEVFLHWMGFPIQVFRALMAALAAVFIIRSLRAFEVEKGLQIVQLQEAQRAERQRLEDLRAELFQRTVRAQEAERKRIAMELHDDTGQTLTALGVGLSALTKNIEIDPQRAINQALQLKQMATTGLDDLRNMVSGLHPPQLDDLGLVSAIRSHAREVSNHSGITVKVINQMQGIELASELRLVLFRIVQEALTNVVRHSQATQVMLRLALSEGQILVEIIDDGIGFEYEAMMISGHQSCCLGLLGMVERASLVNGVCEIQSTPGKGTGVCVRAPVQLEEVAHV
jgi:signal transduction histidine kinase